MIWFTILIPIILSILTYYIFKRAIVWWELLLPMGVSFIFILIFKFGVEKSIVVDYEYRGAIITRARYYESWETWVSQTCTRSYSCNCDNEGNCQTCTETYDCSYCDYNAPKYIAYDNVGNEFTISQAKYQSLIKQWNKTPNFVDLHRNINNSGSCGKDGDMYEVFWDGRIESSEASTWTASFENKVQASHSAFSYPEISQEQARKIGLYDYPKFYDYYKQPAILGLDSFYFSTSAIQKKFEYFNGNYGPKNKIHIFTLLFKNKPIDIAFKQEAYWSGGNQNEVVVCIGLNSDKSIDWVKPFSFCDNKRILINLREDIAELNTFNPDEVLKVYENNVSLFKYKNFKDFDYLSVDMPNWALITAFIITSLISAGLLIWGVLNEFKN